MSNQNLQEKTNDVCEPFKEVNHNKQAKLLERITTKIATYIRQDDNNNDSIYDAVEVIW